MDFSLTIVAKDHDDFRAKIINLARAFGISHTDTKTDNLLSSNIMFHNGDAPSAEQSAIADQKVTAIGEKRKRGRPSEKNLKQENSEKSSDFNTTVAEAVSASNGDAAYTKEDAHQALQKLNTIKGITVARDVLGQFGCVRLSEVKPEQYPDFIEACNAKANE